MPANLDAVDLNVLKAAEVRVRAAPGGVNSVVSVALMCFDVEV